MSELIIYGTLSQVKRKLMRISEVVKNREASGWRLLQSDEKWDYRTKDDPRVCFICRPHHAKVYAGDKIPLLFPGYEILEDDLIHPHTHTGTVIPHPCRCRMYLTNKMDVAEARLHREKEAKI